MRFRATSAAAFTAALLIAGCNGLLKGSKCDDDGSCGGGLQCDPATLTCVDKLVPASDGGLPDQGDGGAGADGATLADAGGSPDATWQDASGLEPDAQGIPPDAAGQASDAEAVPPDAAEPGLDAGPNVDPTRECGDVGWCQARFSYDAGDWPRFNSVSGYRDEWGQSLEVWVGGVGPTALKWNSKRWQDWSSKMATDSASYPISEVTFISVDSWYVFWGGLTSASGGAASCGWGSTGSVTPSFGSQDWCSGHATYGAGWLGGYGPASGPVALVGKDGHIYTYSPTRNLIDDSATEFRAVHFYDTQETWLVGAGGAVRFVAVPEDDEITSVTSVDAKTKGFPATAAELYAVQVFPEALFVGGAGALFECQRSGDIGTIDAPVLSGCENALAAHPQWTIRAFAATSATDIWAVGVDETVAGSPKALLLVRTAKGQWSDRTPVDAAGPLYGIWRDQDLTVVVGANGTLLSRHGAP